MNIMYMKVYAIALAFFLVIDMVWLGLVAKSFYREQIGALMKPEINWIAATFFYLIFVAGLVAFVVAPAIEKGSGAHAFLFGLLFGFVCYATYDLTNLAVTKDWPILITIVDMVWGAVLSSLVSVVSYLIARKIGI